MELLELILDIAARTLTIIICGYVFYSLMMNTHHNNDCTIRYPRLVRYFTGFGSIFYPYLLLMFTYDTLLSLIITLLFFGCLWVFTLCIFITCLNWKITYSDDGFLFRSSFRHSMFFTYSQIDRIKFIQFEYILKIGRRSIHIPCFAENSDDFLLYLQKYRK